MPVELMEMLLQRAAEKGKVGFNANVSSLVGIVQDGTGCELQTDHVKWSVLVAANRSTESGIEWRTPLMKE